MPSVRNLRGYLLIREATSFLGVSEYLRNWDREGRIAAYCNPINGYRLSKVVPATDVSCEDAGWVSSFPTGRPSSEAPPGRSSAWAVGLPGGATTGGIDARPSRGARAPAPRACQRCP